MARAHLLAHPHAGLQLPDMLDSELFAVEFEEFIPFETHHVVFRRTPWGRLHHHLVQLQERDDLHHLTTQYAYAHYSKHRY